LTLIILRRIRKRISGPEIVFDTLHTGLIEIANRSVAGSEHYFIMENLMAKTNIKVPIPIGKPKEMSHLLDRIVLKNTSMEPDTIITNVDMAVFTQRVTDMLKLRLESADLKAQSENKMEQANNMMGTGHGQNIRSTGTLYNDTMKIRDLLLAVYSGNEEQLSEWGFSVVVHESSTHPPAKPEDEAVE
jgi:hypothetical protein